MNIENILRALLKELEITSVTLEDMEFSYTNGWYWITYPENGRESLTTVGFSEYEKIQLDFTGGRDSLVISDVNGVERFTRRILNDIHYFELEESFGNIEKLIKCGIKFSLVEDGEEKFRLYDYEAQVATVDGGLGLSFGNSTIWIRLPKNPKIRIYI